MALFILATTHKNVSCLVSLFGVRGALLVGQASAGLRPGGTDRPAARRCDGGEALRDYQGVRGDALAAGCSTALLRAIQSQPQRLLFIIPTKTFFRHETNVETDVVEILR